MKWVNFDEHVSLLSPFHTQRDSLIKDFKKLSADESVRIRLMACSPVFIYCSYSHLLLVWTAASSHLFPTGKITFFFFFFLIYLFFKKGAVRPQHPSFIQRFCHRAAKCKHKQGSIVYRTLKHVRLRGEVEANGQRDHEDGEEQQCLQGWHQGALVPAGGQELVSQQRRDSDLTVEERRDCNMPTPDVGMSLGGD